jgi:hypothetical protein
MKQVTIFSIPIFLVCALFFCSCGNNGEQKTKMTTTDSTDTSAHTAAATNVPAAKPGNLLVIRHKVAGYAKWKVAYDSHDSTRLVYGLHNFIVARGIKDSNMVMVVLKMDDTAKAKQFIAMPDLKAAMKRGGVVGAPSFLMLDMQMLDTSSNALLSRVTVTHKVKDYDAWKKSFDSHKQSRMDAGLVDRAISYTIGDNHTVSVAFVITDMQKAEAFMNSKDLKDKMAEAGVTGKPDIFFYHVEQSY